MGTRAKFKDFINKNFNVLYDSISQEIMNKRFKQFVEPLIDPRTGKQARPDNNPLFRKRDISKDEFIEYFLGKDVGASTKGTRKDALAAAIAQELGFDATMEVLADPAIQQQIKDIYELQGLRQAENYTAEVGKKIDRIPGAKFSKTKAKEIKPIELNLADTSKDLQTKHKELNKKLQDYWTTEAVREKINQGNTLISIFNDFYNTLNSQEQEALSLLKNEIEVISTAHSIDKDSLTDYDWDAQMLETIEGNIPFNLDIVDTKSFNNYINNLILPNW